MIRLAGKRHLRHRFLHGPAERTFVELWLTEIAGLAINGYADVRGAESAMPDQGRLILRRATVQRTAVIAHPPVIAASEQPAPAGAPALIGEFVRRPRAADQVTARAA